MPGDRPPFARLGPHHSYRVALPSFPKSCYNVYHNQQSPRHQRGLTLTNGRGGEATSSNTHLLQRGLHPACLPIGEAGRFIAAPLGEAGRFSLTGSSVVPMAGCAMASCWYPTSHRKAQAN